MDGGDDPVGVARRRHDGDTVGQGEGIIMAAVDTNDGRSGRCRQRGEGIRDRGEGHRVGDGEQVADVVGRLSVTSRSTNRDLISRLDGRDHWVPGPRWASVPDSGPNQDVNAPRPILEPPAPGVCA